MLLSIGDIEMKAIKHPGTCVSTIYKATPYYIGPYAVVPCLYVPRSLRIYVDVEMAVTYLYI